MRVIPFGDQITMPTVSSGPLVALTAPLSIALWVWMNGMDEPDYNDYATWFKLASEKAVLRYRTLNYGVSAGAEFYVRNVDGSYTSVYPVGAFGMLSWNHVCGTYDLSQMRFYLNGAQVASTGNTLASYVVSSETVSFGAATESGAMRFSGAVSEAGLWNVTLTPDEVAALAAGVRPSRIRGDALIYHVPFFSQDYKTAPVGPYVPEPELSGAGGVGTRVASIPRDEGFGSTPPVDWAPGSFLGIPPT